MNQRSQDDLVLHRIVSFSIVSDHIVRVVFDDGAVRVVNLEPILSGPLFGPLRDPDRFQEAHLEPDFGALEWPNGADIDPIVLYDWPAYVEEITARRESVRER